MHAYGVSGPIARASGVDFDLRRDEPYLAYGELGDTLEVVTRTEGDCLARFECCSTRPTTRWTWRTPAWTGSAELPPGPINQRLPKVLKAPEGHTYAWTENPLGLNGYYLVSKGEKTPCRLKLRSASFNNIQVLGGAAARDAGRRHGGDPRLDVLRRRRHRQVARPARGAYRRCPGAGAEPQPVREQTALPHAGDHPAELLEFGAGR